MKNRAELINFASQLAIRVAVVVALSIITVFALNTMQAYADVENYNVTIDLGENHEDLAETMAASPQEWIIKDFYMWDEATGDYISIKEKPLEHEGSSLIIPLSYNYSVSSFVSGIYSSINKALSLYADSSLHSKYFFHNGEMIFCDPDYYYYSYDNQSIIGFQPMEDYEDSSDFYQDKQTKKELDISDVDSLYLLWGKPIESMDVTIDIPSCGEKVTVDRSGLKPLPDNRPVVTCPEHTDLGEYSPNNSWLELYDHTYWANSFKISYGQVIDPFEGILEGGKRYIAAAYIYANWGYYFSDKPEVTINGEKAEPESRRSPIWPREYELFKYIEVKHDWGAWKTTKQPTTSEYGEMQRVCKGNPSHVEKKRIEKLSPTKEDKSKVVLMAQLTSKGSKSLRISWTKISEVDGYDIFFAQCDEKGKKHQVKLAKSIKGNKSFKWTKNGLKKKTAYKAYVKAYKLKNGSKQYITSSPSVHAYTSGGNKRFTNPKSVTVEKTSVSVKKGKKYTIKGRVKKLKKGKKLIASGHAPRLRYLSSDSNIASVNAKGVISAKRPGKCIIYVYAVNGTRKPIKLTVK